MNNVMLTNLLWSILWSNAVKRGMLSVNAYKESKTKIYKTTTVYGAFEVLTYVRLLLCTEHLKFLTEMLF